MDNYEAYAQLAILNGNGKPQTNSVNLVIDNQNVTCELLQVKNNTQTGYQGYLYQNLETGELYIVHSGSQSLDPGDAPLSDQNRSEVMNDIYKR